MSEMIVTTLGELVEIKYGKDHKKLADGNIPLYGSGGVMRYVEKAIYEKPSILIPRKGSLDNLFYEENPFWTVDTLFWTKINEDIVDPKYLFYLLSLYKLSKYDEGSAVPSLTTKALNDIPISVPKDKSVQVGIRKIIDNIDQKITLLRQQNQDLEELAQTLFKRWFVEFEFPNENGEPYLSSGGKMVESELGEIPEGWRVGNLGELSTLKSGYAFKSNDFVDDSTVKALKIKDLKGKGVVDISDSSSVHSQVTNIERVKYFKLEQGDIVLAMSGNTTGKIGVIPPHEDELYLNQRVGKFFLKDRKLTSLVYCFLMSGNYEDRILSMGYGSAQPNINPSQIENIELAIASKNILNTFSKISDPFYLKVLQNNSEIQTLTQLRDTLLPKLMSGELRVNEIII